MARERVLVVEDEPAIQNFIRLALGKEGYEVQAAASAEEAVRHMRSTPPDVILLDLTLPGMDGLEFCRMLKAEAATRALPIIMVTGRGEEADIVAGLELGADDYLTKPFQPRVLLARLRAVLRRSAAKVPDDQQPIHVHDLTLHPGRHEVRWKDQPIPLTFAEFRLLQVLARRPGWVMTRRQIVDAMRGPDYPVSERVVDVQVLSLRKKLGPAGPYIETVRGVGYRFKE